jgi:hypothetical protein
MYLFTYEMHTRTMALMNSFHRPFNYSPSGHVITGDLNLINQENPRNIASHEKLFF